jgi:hypothetical protein
LFRSLRRRLPAAVAVALTLICTACFTLRLAGDYDEKIDLAATQLQKDMDAHLTNLESLPPEDPARRFAPNRQFYNDYAVNLRSLETRARSMPKNSITVQQVELIAQNVETLRKLHQEQDGLTALSVGEFRKLFNTAWTAVLTFELAKKR